MQAAIDEPALVRRAQRGDVDAFNQLVLCHQQLAYNVAYRVLGDPDAAADVTQDAFTSAYRAIRGFRGSSFKPWLLRIVTNCCYDVLRARQRRPSVSLEALLEDDDNPLSLPDPGETPEGAALRRELLRCIREGLLTLPVEQRLAVTLYDVQGLSYDEIAEVTHSSLGTVKSRLSRGRSHLRAYLQKHGELLPAQHRHESS